MFAAGYGTFSLYNGARIDLRSLAILTPPSLVAAFVGGLLVLKAQTYFVLTGLLLLAAGVLLVFKTKAELSSIRECRPASPPRSRERLQAYCQGSPGWEAAYSSRLCSSYLGGRLPSAQRPFPRHLSSAIQRWDWRASLWRGKGQALTRRCMQSRHLQGSARFSDRNTLDVGTQHPICSRGHPPLRWASPPASLEAPHEATIRLFQGRPAACTVPERLSQASYSPLRGPEPRP